MQIIDKNSDSTKLYFTLSENTSIQNPFYLLVINHYTTGKKYQIILPENISQYPERIDEFLLDTQIFKDMEVGQYSYAAFQSETEPDNESSLGKPIEVGMLKIIDNNSNADTDFIIIED